MSKASEFAARLAAKLKRPSCFQVRSGIYTHRTYANVSDDGKLVLTSYRNLDTEEAIALAHWIIDTFGEPAKEQADD